MDKLARPNRFAATAFPAALLLALIGLWQWSAGRQGSGLIPGPGGVLHGLLDLLHHGLLVRYTVASLFRVTWGFGLAAAVGIPLGLFLGSSRVAGDALSPVLSFLRPISPLAWIPIAILWFGVGDASAVFLIFLACFFPLVFTGVQAARGVEVNALRAGANFGLGRAQLFTRVLLPGAAPRLMLGMRIALGVGWLVVVAAEMIAVNSGLGFLIVDARNAGNRYDLVLAGMVTIGVLGLLLDAGMRAVERSFLYPAQGERLG